jgi:GT2 family glycosyltransferase
MKLSVVVVSWNTKDLLRECLVALKQEVQDIACEVFVIDNNSADGSADMVALEHPWVKLTKNAENLGFAKANNQAIKLAQGEYVLLLNPDTKVMSGAIHTLLRFMDNNPECGVVAPQLLNTDGSIQRSCRQFPTFAGMLYELMGLSKLFPNDPTFRQYKMLDFDHDKLCQVDQPEGACLLLRKTVIEQVGILDEGFFMLFEEVDWCYRIKQQGWQIWFTPEAQVVHHYGQSIKQVKVAMIWSSHRGLYRFWHKHYRNGRWFLDGIAWAGLMGLAWVRIASYKLRQALNVSASAS